uniref:Uncharacterized protein n=1 Tax=Eutreptiella gymnastica TaxID=73025 RepID=A0A7S4CH63_9EUGL
MQQQLQKLQHADPSEVWDLDDSVCSSTSEGEPKPKLYRSRFAHTTRTPPPAQFTPLQTHNQQNHFSREVSDEAVPAQQTPLPQGSNPQTPVARDHAPMRMRNSLYTSSASGDHNLSTPSHTHRSSCASSFSNQANRHAYRDLTNHSTPGHTSAVSSVPPAGNSPASGASDGNAHNLSSDTSFSTRDAGPPYGSNRSTPKAQRRVPSQPRDPTTPITTPNGTQAAQPRSLRVDRPTTSSAAKTRPPSPLAKPLMVGSGRRPPSPKVQAPGRPSTGDPTMPTTLRSPTTNLTQKLGRKSGTGCTADPRPNQKHQNHPQDHNHDRNQPLHQVPDNGRGPRRISNSNKEMVPQTPVTSWSSEDEDGEDTRAMLQRLRQER